MVKMYENLLGGLRKRSKIARKNKLHMFTKTFKTSKIPLQIGRNRYTKTFFIFSLMYCKKGLKISLQNDRTLEHSYNVSTVIDLLSIVYRHQSCRKLSTSLMDDDDPTFNGKTGERFNELWKQLSSQRCKDCFILLGEDLGYVSV